MSNQRNEELDQLYGSMEERIAAEAPDVDTNEAVRAALEARRVLSEEQKKKIEAAALRDYNDLKHRDTGVMNYGITVFKDLNATIAEYHERTKDLDSTVLDAELTSMGRAAARVDAYNPEGEDVNQARQIAERLAAERDGSFRWFGLVKDVLEEYEVAKANSVAQMKRVRDAVTEALTFQLEQVDIDQLFIFQHTSAVVKLVEIIATMEQMLDMATEELQLLETNPPVGKAPHEIQTEKETLNEFIALLRQQLLNYRNSWWMSRAKIQRLRARKLAHRSLAMQLRTHMSQTLPAIEDAIVEVGNIIKAMQGASLSTKLTDQANSAQVKVARMAGEAVTDLHKAGLTPTYKAETIKAIGAFVAKTHNSMAENLRNFAAQEADNLAAMVNADRQIRDSHHELTDQALNNIMQAASARLAVMEQEGKGEVVVDDDVLKDTQ